MKQGQNLLNEIWIKAEVVQGLGLAQIHHSLRARRLTFVHLRSKKINKNKVAVWGTAALHGMSNDGILQLLRGLFICDPIDHLTSSTCCSLKYTPPPHV